MIRIFTALFVYLFSNMCLAQVITTEPAYPTENDSIVIFLDATKPGAEELLNYTGTLYAHTGVNTNVGAWQHVKGTWGNNTTQPALTRISSNYYKLSIGKPRQFYGVTNVAEKINALAIVIRTSDGSKQTRPDIFINLFEPGITIVINSPEVSTSFGDPLRSPAFASFDDTVLIDINAAEIGTSLSSLLIYVNNVQVAQSDSNRIIYNFISSEYSSGINKIAAVAKDASALTDSIEFIIFINPEVQNEPLPIGMKYGINYENPTKITVALLAPYKEFIYVLGDFNDWKVNTNYYMKRDSINASEVVWWLTINGLTPGQEYAFQYLVDGEIRVGDPYCEKILDPWNDQYIFSSTYPGLKAYPSGKTSEAVSILQTNQTAYNWTITNFQKPAKADLIIYELLIRDFLSTHDYQTLQDTLNYLKNLGVNAIELMPVNEFEGNISWGYNPSFHLALDKYYGPKNELKVFIDKAHELGIAVILDVVLNHVFGQSPLARLYWDALSQRPASNNLWLNPVAKHDFNVGFDFNHESQATKNYVDRVVEYWINEYKVDGFRFDLSKGFTQKNTLGNVNLWGQYDQTRVDIWKRIADKIWSIDSTFYIILEHFADNSEEIVLSNYGMMLWGNMNYQYNEATMGYASDLNAAYYKNKGWQYPHLVTYMESHDEERLMYKNLTYGNSNGSYNIKNLNVALNRMKLAAAFFFTIPGPKMIWQFGELGYDYSINWPSNTSNDRLTPKPIRWDYFTNADRLKLYKVFSEIIKLTRNYEAFKNGTFTSVLSGYAKRINITHSSMDVAIVGNFHAIAIGVNPSFSRTGKWYDYFSGDSIDVTDVNMLMTMQPGEFKIFTTIKLPTPESGLITNIETEEIDSSPNEFRLYQNYPNPFNPITKIDWQLAASGPVRLTVFDILGNEVAILIN
ncbi:MAG: hypothetical protein HXY50_09100 [Ignavibacteriaceae bacterium]|nr:hypothetical protein [Ignavibacteriaceae bacterium]